MCNAFHNNRVNVYASAASEWYEDSVEVKSLSDFHNVAVLLRQCQEVAGQHSAGSVQVGLAYKLLIFTLNLTLMTPRLHSVGKATGGVHF